MFPGFQVISPIVSSVQLELHRFGAGLISLSGLMIQPGDLERLTTRWVPVVGLQPVRSQLIVVELGELVPAKVL